MEEETRAALEWAVDEARHPSDGSPPRGLHAARLQALLDAEKGGDGPGPKSGGLKHRERQGSDPAIRASVAGAASTAPPDSPASGESNG